MKEFIFKQKRTSAYEIEKENDFVLIDSPFVFIRHMLKVLKHGGIVDWIKIGIKSFTGARLFYFIHMNGKIAACGTLSVAFCNFYDVEPNSVVVGSVWTDEALRGQGLATRSIKSAVNAMMDKGHTVFYIDTQETNIAMLRSIEKLGFGDSIGSYES